jgi:hypothetical protein
MDKESDFLQHRVSTARRYALLLSQCSFSAAFASIAYVQKSLARRKSYASSGPVPASSSVIASALPWASIMESRAIETFCEVAGLENASEVLQLFHEVHMESSEAFAKAASAAFLHCSVIQRPAVVPLLVAVAVATWRLLLFTHTVACHFVVSEVFGVVSLLGPDTLGLTDERELLAVSPLFRPPDQLNRGASSLAALPSFSASKTTGEEICSRMLERQVRGCFQCRPTPDESALDRKSADHLRGRLRFVASAYVGVPVLFSSLDEELVAHLFGDDELHQTVLDFATCARTTASGKASKGRSLLMCFMWKTGCVGPRDAALALNAVIADLEQQRPETAACASPACRQGRHRLSREEAAEMKLGIAEAVTLLENPEKTSSSLLTVMTSVSTKFPQHGGLFLSLMGVMRRACDDLVPVAEWREGLASQLINACYDALPAFQEIDNM